MRVSVVSDKVLPMPTGGGPKMNQWAIIEELRQQGHQVQVVWITPNTEIDFNTAVGLQALQARGTIVCPIIQGNNPEVISRGLFQFQPDIIFALSTWSMAWAMSYSRAKKVLMLGDPEHLIESNRRQAVSREALSYEEIAALHESAQITKGVYFDVVNQCDYVFCSAVQSVEWFRSQGLAVDYIPMPMVEPAFLGWKRREVDFPQRERPRILMLGHLGGMATISSLNYLLEDILPNMLDYTEYEWRICGGDALIPRLAKQFERYPEIEFKGYVEDIRREILEADILLSPTSSTIGVRCRIIEGWSLGACVVAHSANVQGQPEALPGNNLVTFDTGEQAVEALAILKDDPPLRAEIGAAGRQTWEANFRTELSAGQVVRKMEELVNV